MKLSDADMVEIFNRAVDGLCDRESESLLAASPPRQPHPHMRGLMQSYTRPMLEYLTLKIRQTGQRVTGAGAFARFETGDQAAAAVFVSLARTEKELSEVWTERAALEEQVELYRVVAFSVADYLMARHP